MSTSYTENYHLGKQLNKTDTFSMDVITDNMDIIDEAMKENADNIASTMATVGEHTTNIGENTEDIATLEETVNTISDSLFGSQSDIRSMAASISSISNTLNRYAVPKSERDISASRCNNFYEGILVGNFQNDIVHTDVEGTFKGVLFAYNVGTESSWVILQILVVSNTGLVLGRCGFATAMGDFIVLCEGDGRRPWNTLTSESLSSTVRGTLIGDIGTDITGAANVTKGVVRTYSYSPYIVWDTRYGGPDRLQIVETEDGTRKTRYYTESTRTWSAWV